MEHIDNTLARLKKIWEKNPQLRLTQLLIGCGNLEVLYYSSDAEMLALLDRAYGIDTLNVKPEPAEIKVKEVIREVVVETGPRNKGRIYIHNTDGEMKSVHKEDLQKFLDSGWKLGRKEKH